MASTDPIMTKSTMTPTSSEAFANPSMPDKTLNAFGLTTKPKPTVLKSILKTSSYGPAKAAARSADTAVGSDLAEHNDENMANARKTTTKKKKAVAMTKKTRAAAIVKNANVIVKDAAMTDVIIKETTATDEALVPTSFHDDATPTASTLEHSQDDKPVAATENYPTYRVDEITAAMGILDLAKRADAGADKDVAAAPRFAEPTRHFLAIDFFPDDGDKIIDEGESFDSTPPPPPPPTAPPPPPSTTTPMRPRRVKKTPDIYKEYQTTTIDSVDEYTAKTPKKGAGKSNAGRTPKKQTK